MQGYNLHTTSFDNQVRFKWKPLGLLNLYRLMLATLAVIVSYFWPELLSLHDYDHRLFLITSLAYLLYSGVSHYAIHWQKPGFRIQLNSQIAADIIAIAVMLHASGGVRSGLGLLLITTVAGGGILLSRRMAILAASIATLAMLMNEVYLRIENVIDNPYYTQAGLLGIVYFLTAITAHLLARRASESEALADQRGVDLANMQRLTEYIIQRMQTGVMVVDASGRIHLMNESAANLLAVQPGSGRRQLANLVPELDTRLRTWQQHPEMDSHLLHVTSSNAEILPRFAHLGDDHAAGTLIFLEDMSATAQQAQQLKLASLGRLTASIAHEIRNPLGAISHAGQLLAESASLAPGDIRLTDIIRSHSRRMNTIVENILQLSRRQQTHPEDFELRAWLELFIAEFSSTQGINAASIQLDISPAHTHVRFDPSQLHQIIWNLCHNGIRYSMKQVGIPKLLLRGGTLPDSPNPYLDIIDFGPGINADDAEHLFEPFFTTEPKGTGLGLYISRELCESNQARLGYRPISTGGGCFRIIFADPRRRQVA